MAMDSLVLKKMLMCLKKCNYVDDSVLNGRRTQDQRNRAMWAKD